MPISAFCLYEKCEIISEGKSSDYLYKQNFSAICQSYLFSSELSKSFFMTKKSIWSLILWNCGKVPLIKLIRWTKKISAIDLNFKSFSWPIVIKTMIKYDHECRESRLVTRHYLKKNKFSNTLYFDFLTRFWDNVYKTKIFLLKIAN